MGVEYYKLGVGLFRFRDGFFLGGMGYLGGSELFLFCGYLCGVRVGGEGGGGF